MSTQISPIAEVNERATQALVMEIGVADTIRFLHQFRSGQGNYTQERKKLLSGLTVTEIISEIKSMRDRASAK